MIICHQPYCKNRMERWRNIMLPGKPFHPDPTDCAGNCGTSFRSKQLTASRLLWKPKTSSVPGSTSSSNGRARWGRFNSGGLLSSRLLRLVATHQGEPLASIQLRVMPSCARLFTRVVGVCCYAVKQLTSHRRSAIATATRSNVLCDGSSVLGLSMSCSRAGTCTVRLYVLRVHTAGSPCPCWVHHALVVLLTKPTYAAKYCRRAS